ncbi:MAG: HAMP domain-containing protein, partial [Gammaproteobacteria bacterium]|nr:HAMP domain-containing protein [Gammaproteobacteria bacterium]
MMKSLNKAGRVALFVNVAAGATLAVSMIMGNLSEKSLVAAETAKFDSYLLMDELRQSSDDLTRLARTYVSTGNAIYEDQYNQILKIRNGEQPRPEEYHRIYWDFVAAEPNSKPRPTGESVALRDLMRRAGFTDSEFNLLNQAAANSDALVAAEVKAMNAVKGIFQDRSGNYTVYGEPNMDLARELMFNRDYHGEKAKIMAPIDQAFVQLEQRVSAEIESAASIYNLWSMIAAIAAVATIAAGMFTIVVLRKSMAAIGYANEIAAEISQGHLENDIDLERQGEVGELNRALHTMQEQIGESLENSKREAREMMRIKKALDMVGANVMMADPDLNIVYLNHSVERTMRDAESDLKQALPSFDASNLLGRNIDMFHKDPSHQRRMLGSLSTTFASEIKVGVRTFRIVANPVRDDEGKPLGTVVEWTDRTQELAVENEVREIVEASKAGDLSKRISVKGKQGFFEILAKGVNELVEVADGITADTLRVLKALSDGDLRQRIDGNYEGTFAELKDSANQTANRLSDIVVQIQRAASEVSVGAQEISTGNADLSRRTETQAASLDETSSSMEEMTGTVRANSTNADRADELATSARTKAESGGQVVSKAVEAMREINDSSTKISDITSVINEIAFQTNLLALNAAVEAARAGEQGKGFAVVASEVRNLAQRSASAAKEIEDLIHDSVGKVTEGTRLVDESGKTLSEIVEAVKTVSEIITDIAAAGREQSIGIDQVNRAISQMDEMT